MELIVDDRERAVIPHLADVKVERITVGDYAFVYNGKVVVIVERKSLADLASSIKDGRMENNNKLLEAQAQHGCHILYIIEGPAYPTMTKKFGRMPYKCLQGKLDSLMFRNDIKIIWTRDTKHTAERLTGLRTTFTKFANDGVYGVIGGDEKKYEEVVKTKHTADIEQIHVQMVSKLASRKLASTVLKHYNIVQILTGQVGVCTEIKYEDSGVKLGQRGSKFQKTCTRLITSPDLQKNILSCINGVTADTAEKILTEVPFVDIVLSKTQGKISGIKKSEKRSVGKAVEERIKRIFTL